MNIRKLVASAVLFLIVMSSPTQSYAGSKDTTNPYDPQNMTWEERIEWVESHITPIQYETNEVFAMIFAYRGEWHETNLAITPIRSAYSGLAIGRLETRAKFLCDDNYTVVQDTGTLRFAAIPSGNNTATTEYFRKWLAPNNVKVIYTAWFASVGGADFVEHHYNFHGHGAYDLRVVTSASSSTP